MEKSPKDALCTPDKLNPARSATLLKPSIVRSLPPMVDSSKSTMAVGRLGGLLNTVSPTRSLLSHAMAPLRWVKISTHSSSLKS